MTLPLTGSLQAVVSPPGAGSGTDAGAAGEERHAYCFMSHVLAVQRAGGEPPATYLGDDPELSLQGHSRFSCSTTQGGWRDPPALEVLYRDFILVFCKDQPGQPPSPPPNAGYLRDCWPSVEEYVERGTYLNPRQEFNAARTGCKIVTEFAPVPFLDEACEPIPENYGYASPLYDERFCHESCGGGGWAVVSSYIRFRVAPSRADEARQWTFASPYLGPDSVYEPILTCAEESGPDWPNSEWPVYFCMGAQMERVPAVHRRTIEEVTTGDCRNICPGPEENASPSAPASP